MTEWSREERYRRLEDVDQSQLETLKQQVETSMYRQTFHIQPETGLLNDPNGLIYFKGKYYVSHQWFPLGAVHGLKYWFNYTSKDLVTFEPHGVILKPDTLYDSHGVYSGSAFEWEGQLYYMYTGNHRDESWNRVASQMLAKVEEDGTVKKLDKPVIAHQPKGYTSHFRDPKVFQKDGQYYAIIGAQNNEELGRLLLYKAENNQLEEWALVGELKTELEAFGFMWECPDYFELDNKDVILFSPQGIEAQGDQFRNIYQSGYLIGNLDLETLQFNHGEFIELDNGFDFYAPQTFIDEHGKRILIGWMGLPEINYPTDSEGWAHCLTIPRELTIEEGKLHQRPLKALEKLRQNKETALGYANKFPTTLRPYEGKQYELIIDILDNEASELYFELRTSKLNSTLITYNSKQQTITLDRSESGLLPDNVEDLTRNTTLDTPLKQLQIFVDTSSIEIFCNDGERVLTSRIFPDDISTGIKTSTESGQVYLQFTKYELKGED
ncbi:sucrose-6-phosphate hydrolase [Staphylococcus devriesei]|uniref:Sucrose-6-phosphate hydrolase n=1 Tax=Staphylococcus devriesei TaxID=586733 RepID=A0ABX5I142_9STAP|nr:sucrose-6-phosphate hydrolase [Staphylococcus devriesei]MCE5097967.1 sucrose-6-phosphate hydrolase [Staphylococcus devriesei]PNZ89635.1 sucrose-6-phosphate hydrolase [Staphylococcus devriesei]PTF02504.1 sucrose-6-phosphate hydrolase [Staphylococcus devriesei]PTF13896.1 sucrose-6-phosphate hydrolase [Staphylococcus devriesei]PTF18120.1 sucrose-6-phosphate hydrolase [Staphylococcus devriesei]